MSPAAPRQPRIILPRPVERPWGGDGIPSLGLRSLNGKPTGEWWLPTDDFRALVKILDARDNLSVQLHPDDDAARARGLPCGKTEAWFVIDCQPDARILLGLKDSVSEDTLFADARAGRDIAQHLHSFTPTPGELVFVPPGTLHAICAGCVLLEVQQVSDTTYRVWDWNRRPARPLHLDEARAALRRDPRAGQVHASRLDCEHFAMQHVRLAGPGTTQAPTPMDSGACLIFCVAGRGATDCSGHRITLHPGTFVLVPGDAGPVTLHTDGTDELELVLIAVPEARPTS